VPEPWGADPVELDAGRLAGLLAEPGRLRVVAALALGASSTAEVVRSTGLDGRAVGSALGRLVDAGLVERGRDGTLVLLEVAFATAARAARSSHPRDGADAAGGDSGEGSEAGGASGQAARVLRVFIRDGRLTQIPAQRSKRLVVLDRLAQEFEPGERYSESRVNLILGRWHPDTATCRRYLVDEGFLGRDHGVYWRTGGTVDVS
jgi:hypothetical protein